MKLMYIHDGAYTKKGGGMNFSNAVMETTRKYLLPKLREETKLVMCGDTIASKMLGVKPVDENTRQKIYELIDSMTDEQFEEFYIEAHKDDPDF